MQPETFLVFIAIFFQILDPAKKLSSAVSSIQGGMASLERVSEVLDYDLRVEEIENPLIQKVRYLDKLIDELAKGKRWKRF